MIDGILRYNRFDQLVNELRSAGELDEAKYKKLRAHFKRLEMFTRVFVLIFVLPSFILLLLVTYEFWVLNRGYWPQYLFNSLGLTAVCFVGAYLSTAHQRMMWEYCYLMAYGNKCNGYVLSHCVNVTRPVTTCVYSFVDSAGRSHVGNASVSNVLSEYIEMYPGDNVEILYMPNNPKFSVFVFEKMDLFRIKK